jgi:hypothetical protein
MAQERHILQQVVSRRLCSPTVGRSRRQSAGIGSLSIPERRPHTAELTRPFNARLSHADGSIDIDQPSTPSTGKPIESASRRVPIT